MQIASESPLTGDVTGLLAEHLTDMYATSPPESVHALDPVALTSPDITFITARDDDGGLLGCGALKLVSESDAEIKSMRTTASARGRGVAAAVLGELIELARDHGCTRVSLETGAEDYFAPARRLYERHRFVPCAPFADYTDDPNSRYFTLDITERP